MALFSVCGGGACPFFLGLGVATCSCSLCTGLVLVTCGDSLCSPLSAAPAPPAFKSQATHSALSGASYIGSSGFDGSSSFGGSDLVFSTDKPWTADQYAAYLARAAPSTSRMSRLPSDNHYHSLSDYPSHSLPRSPGALSHSLLSRTDSARATPLQSPSLQASLLSSRQLRSLSSS
ncbi:hypothetical protein CLOP_g7391 [Closterium sp. NIES-67]|nr:hypothetical protein CLOP_g7391 [Closterium sp. NIES-67]